MELEGYLIDHLKSHREGDWEKVSRYLEWLMRYLSDQMAPVCVE